MCFTSIEGFRAAFLLRLRDNAVIIALCHTHSVNSPIALCVNFGLQISPCYLKTLGKQENINILPILYWQ